MNPKRAKVECAEGVFLVPYGLLEHGGRLFLSARPRVGPMECAKSRILGTLARVPSSSDSAAMHHTTHRS